MISRSFASITVGLEVLAQAALGQPSLPSTFKAQTITSPEGADIFVRSGGSGPVVVLLHGYPETSDSWGPLAAELVKGYTVVVPDLRGIGHSSRPAGGYDKKTQAADIRAVVTALGYDRASVVAHDIGNMVAYAYAARYPDKVEKLVVMDAPIPGIAPWDEIVRNPALWHFSFHGPDAERLVQGRERIYLDRIWNDFTGDPGQPDEATRAFYAAQYAQPGAMRAGFAQFTAFSQDAKRQPVVSPSEADHARADHRRREILWPHAGRHHEGSRDQRPRGGGSRRGALAHGGESEIHSRFDPGLSQRSAPADSSSPVLNCTR